MRDEMFARSYEEIRFKVIPGQHPSFPLSLFLPSFLNPSSLFALLLPYLILFSLPLLPPVQGLGLAAVVVMGRAPCCDKDNVKRGPWSPDEDRVLKTYIEKYGTGGNWIALPRKAGLRRCGKSCRLRWLNYLQPGIKHGGFTKEEDNIIATLYQTMGSRWSAIAAQLPGRTDNDVKNYWNTKLKKVYLTEDKPRNKAKTTLSNKPSERTPWIPATQAIPTLATEPHEPSTVNHNRSSSSSRSFLMESDLHLIVAQNFSEPSTGRVLSSTHDVSPASSSLTVDSVIGGGRGDHGGGGGGGFDGYDEQLFMDMDFWSTPDLPDWSGIHEHRVAGENDDQQEPCQDFTCMWESISI